MIQPKEANGTSNLLEDEVSSADADGVREALDELDLDAEAVDADEDAALDVSEAVALSDEAEADASPWNAN